MNELIEVLRHVPVGGISFAGIVSLAIIMIFRGDIVPKSSLERELSGRDSIIESKNEDIAMLKEAYAMSEKARLISAESDRELLEIGRTTVHMLTSIQERAEGVRR